MNRLRATLLGGALVAAFATPAAAQLPALSLEVTPTFGVSTGGFAGTNPGPGAGAGVGAGAGATLGLGPLLALYGGYQYVRFACDGCAQGGLADAVEDLGWEAGVQANVPFTALGLRPWVRAGAIGHQLQFTGSQDRLASRPSVGFAAGAGAYLPLAGPLSLVPAVRYRAYAAEFRFSTLPAGTEGSSRSTDVSYFTVDLGLALRF